MRIPEGVREVIGRRLDRLSEPLQRDARRRLGHRAGVRARPAERLVEDASEDRLLELLEEALAARVIEELPGAPGRYQFTHALIQETLAEELSLTRTRAAPRAASPKASRRSTAGTQISTRPSSLTTSAGPDASRPGQARPLLARRGRGRAGGPCARAGARSLRARARRERRRRRWTTRPQRSTLASAAPSWPRSRRYELEPASTSLRRAFDYYAQAGDVSRAVAVAAHPIPLSLGLGYTDFPELIARALTLVARIPPRRDGCSPSTAGTRGIVEADYEEAQRAFQRALSIAQRQDDAALERRTLANAAWVDVWHFRSQDCLEKGLRAIELAGQRPATSRPRSTLAGPSSGR